MKASRRCACVRRLYFSSLDAHVRSGVYGRCRTGALDELAELLARRSKRRRTGGCGVDRVARAAARELLEQTDRMQARNVYYTGLDWEPKSRGLLDALGAPPRRRGRRGRARRPPGAPPRRRQGPAAEAMALVAGRGARGAGRRRGGGASARARAIAPPRERRAARTPRSRLPASAASGGSWRSSGCSTPSARATPANGWSAYARPPSSGGGAGTPREAARGPAARARSSARRRVDPGRPRRHAAGGGRRRRRGRELTASIEAHARPRGGARSAPRARAERAGRRWATRPVRSRTWRPRSRSIAPPTRGALARSSSTPRGRRRERGRGRRARPAPAPGPGAALRGRRRRGADDPERSRSPGPQGQAALWTLASLETAPRAVGRGERRAEAPGRRWRTARPRSRPHCGWPTRANARGGRATRAAPSSGRASWRRRTARCATGCERVYEQTGAWHELADIALEDARASGDVAERFAPLLRAGVLLLEHAGDPAAAMAPWRRRERCAPPIPIASRRSPTRTRSRGGAGRPCAARAGHRPQKGQARRGARATVLPAGAVRALPRATRPASCASLLQALDCDAQNGQVCSDVALRPSSSISSSWRTARCVPSPCSRRRAR